MNKPIKYLLFTITISLSLLATACGPDTSTQEAVIQTAVAQTVAAQTTVEVANTATPSAPLVSTQTPFQLPTPLGLLTSTVPPPNTSKADCAKASLVSETIVDGTIFKPGTQFTKTWEITNTSNCVWDTSYKIVYWSGDIMGGGYVYNLPQVVGPGQTIPISLVLIAPTADGTYRSEWKLQTPDKFYFGAGTYNSPFFTEIVVSSSIIQEYAVTSMELSVVRDPIIGCPTNTTYTAYATFTTNGPLEFKYRWLQQDGNNPNPQTINMTTAGKKTVSREWKLIRSASQNDNRWFAIVITEPVYTEYPTVGFGFHCP
ncbi:MAG: NBR1-Ig-like domain-containing protein [Anaerolineales bacterium]|nr:NBR1-Ig-like domain-containing protein [Anaerolineales bacterium]